MSTVELDLSRRQTLMRRVMQKVQGWQTIYMTSEYEGPSVARGRYEAARLFYEWLAEGHPLEAVPAYLQQQTAYWTKEMETFEMYALQLQLADRLAKGLETRESLRNWTKFLIPGFNATEGEQQHLDNLRVQYGAARVELWHLHRLLKDL